MQIKLPKPFFFEEGKRAVLLLHGFTGNSSDVRQLGRFFTKERLYIICTAIWRPRGTTRWNTEI